MHSSQLENFLMIIECGSINKAAQRLYMSQPTLSQQLKQLEDELGTNLFVREGRRLVLTPEGKVLAEFAQKQMNGLKKTIDKINAMKYGANEEIAIGIAQTSLIPDVGRWVGLMNKKHHNINYRFINYNMEKTLDLMENGQLDIVITRQIFSNAEFLAAYECIPIKQHSVIAVLPPKLNWIYKEEISLKDIDGQNVIIRGKHDKRFVDKCAAYDSVPVVKCLCRNNILKLELVRNGVGIGFFVDSIVDTELFKNYGLRYCRVKEITMNNTTYIVYPKVKKDAPAIKYLLETILSEV